MGCQSDIAAAIVDGGGNDLLATKDHQSNAHAKILSYFATVPAEEIGSLTEIEKNRGRLETRRHRISTDIDWMAGHRRYPDELRFKNIAMIGLGRDNDRTQ